MADRKKLQNDGIPAWQRADGLISSDQNNSLDQQQTQSASIAKPSSAIELQTPSTQHKGPEQALRFLEDESIRYAPTEEKIAFLESKGVAPGNIEQAMNQFKSTEHSNPPAPLVMASEHASSLSPPNQQSSDSFQSRDVPPIITYPEFLVQTRKPPPLVTRDRLVNTAYVASAAAAVVYGLSHFIVTPMVESLTAARHDFAQNTQSRLEELNERLAEIVTVDPKTQPKRNNGSDEVDGASEVASLDSDPTELFHRDFGTQTSPSLTTLGSPSTTTNSESADIISDAVMNHAFKIDSIRTLCADMAEDAAEESQSMKEMIHGMSTLTDYLDSLVYPTYPINTTATYGSAEKTGVGKKEDDEISKMRAEIRGVKGVLLSARNFPSGGRKSYWPTAGSK